MAIGAGEELGVVFGKWSEMNERERDLWCSTFRERFGDNLLKGYATLAYPIRYTDGVYPKRYGEEDGQ